MAIVDDLGRFDITEENLRLVDETGMLTRELGMSVGARIMAAEIRSLRTALATTERERDEARKDSRRIDCLEQVMSVVMPSGRHWIDYDYSGDLRSALDDSMEKLT